MAETVLVDGSHLLRRQTTGIGTYSRSLIASLRSLGKDVGLLFGENVTQSDDAAIDILAAQIFGNLPSRRSWEKIAAFSGFLKDGLLPAWASARATKVSLSGVDLSAYEPSLPDYDALWNAAGLYERASVLFATRQRFLELDPPDGAVVAHWTHALPVKARKIPNIYTIHDMIPVQLPYFVLDKGGRAVKLHHAIARQADLIITVSEASKRHIVDLLRVPDERVHVTYQSIPEVPRLPARDAESLVASVYGARPGNYALYVGAIEPKKNLRRLIEAHLLANTGMPLLIAGPLGWLYDDDLALIETIEAQFRTRRSGMGSMEGEFAGGRGAPVRRLGYLPRRHVTALLQCAAYLAFPSIYEGFGLPVLEAMQLGVPVLTSACSSLPEVAGDAAVFVEPLNVSDMTEKIRWIAGDRDLRADLAARGPVQARLFSRDAHASRLREAYQRVGITFDSNAVQPAPIADDGRRALLSPVAGPA